MYEKKVHTFTKLEFEKFIIMIFYFFVNTLQYILLLESYSRYYDIVYRDLREVAHPIAM